MINLVFKRPLGRQSQWSKSISGYCSLTIVGKTKKYESFGSTKEYFVKGKTKILKGSNKSRDSNKTQEIYNYSGCHA